MPKESDEKALIRNARQLALAESVSPSTKSDLIPESPPSKLENVATGVARGALQTGQGFVDFATSPLGLVTLGTGALPKLGQNLHINSFLRGF